MFFAYEVEYLILEMIALIFLNEIHFLGLILPTFSSIPGASIIFPSRLSLVNELFNNHN